MPFASRRFYVLAPLALGLGIAGCSGNGGDGGGNVATVNGQPITNAAFYKKVDATSQAKGVFQQMVQSDLIDSYAKDNKIDIPDSAVNTEEDQIKARLPPGQFEQVLKQQNLTEPDVRNILREKLIVEKAIGDKIKVSDAEISAYIAKNHTTLDTPMQVRAKHILVPDLATAQKVEGLLKGGGSFEALAKQYSVDPSTKDKGGELGFFGKGQMVAPFQNAAFAQPIGVVGPPVKSPFGYHIIVVQAKRAPMVANVRNAGDKVRKLLQQQQEQTQIPQFLAMLRSKANIKIENPAFQNALPPAGGAPAAAAPAGQ